MPRLNQVPHNDPGMEGVPSPEQARAAVDAIPDADLVTELLRLTHVIHSYFAVKPGSRHERERNEYRAKRDLVEAEVLRRMAEGRS